MNGIFEIAGAPLKKMNSLRELIDYLVKNPSLKDIKDQSSIVLKHPFHTTSFLASSIDERIEVLNKINDAGKVTVADEVFPLLSVCLSGQVQVVRSVYPFLIQTCGCL